MPAPPDFKNDPPKFRLLTESFGWPARSMVIYEAILITGGSSGGAIDERALYDDLRARAGLGMGIQTPAWMPQIGRLRSALPVLPVWAGLAANSGLYGVIVLGGLLAPRAVRRYRRRWNGCCVGCGYDLAGLDRCPECGAAATPSTRPGPVVVSKDTPA